MPTKEKEIDDLIHKRELGELFDSKYALNINLWRGQKAEDKSNPPLYPILKSFKLSNGRVRKKDIRTYTKNGESWIDCKSGGVSLFDVLGVPNKKWEYYKLPAGVRIPFGLVITKDEFNDLHRATHYSIRANWDMPLTKFLMLLDELAAQLIFEK